MSDFETFKSAIFGQESGNGAVDTSKPNYAGALGKGQILRPTFEGLKKQGKIPADYEWTNPAHNEEAAVKYMEEAWSAGSGRPDLAAAYYYGGPKAIKGGQIVSYRDTKNPKAPDTIGYAKSVMQRMGLEVSAPTPRQIDNAIERKPDAVDYSRLIEASIQSSVIRPPDRDAFARSLTEDQWQRDITEEARPSTWEQFSAAVASNTDNRVIRALDKRVWGEEFEVDPSFKADLTKLPKGADSVLIEDYATATSQQAADKVLRLHDEEEARNKTIFDSGTATGFALSLGGEFTSVSNIIPYVAVAKALQMAGKGSLALAQAGRSGASIGSAVAENVLSGTAIEAGIQGLNSRLNAQNLAISLAADTLIGIGAGALTLRWAATATAAQATERAAANVVERELSYIARAERELGPDADPAAIRARVASYPGEDARGAVEQAIVPTSSSRLLATEPEVTPAAVTQADVPEARANFDSPGALLSREQDFMPGGRFADAIGEYSGGLVKTVDELHALPAGVHFAGKLPADVKPAVDTLQRLVKQFLPEYRITINALADATLKSGQRVNGAVAQVSDRAAMIKVDGTMAQSQIIRTLVHEVGHVVFNSQIGKLAPTERAKLVDALADFVKTSQTNRTDGNAARGKRYSVLNSSLGANKEKTVPLTTPYEHSWDEFSAEQFVKYVERDVAGENKLGLKRDVVSILRAAIKRALDFLRAAKRENIPVTNEYAALFDTILQGPEAQKALRGQSAAAQLDQVDAPIEQAAVRATPTEVANELLGDPDAVRYGISLAPMGTPKERADAQAILALHKRAAEWAVNNPIDLNAIDKLMSASAFSGKLASSGLIMLKSQSPVVRMIASELLEDAGGVAGKRKATAAISKYMTERFMLGSAIPEMESAFNFWKKANGGSVKDDLIGGAKWTEFNKLVASEIEARRFNQPGTQDPSVKGAADVLEAAYTRIASEQVKVGTTGAGALPSSSRGYMPHRMNAGQVLNLSPAKREVLHAALVDQFITIEGWDATFAAKLAASYIDRVRARGAGDFGSAIGGRGSASEVEEALRGMDLPEDVIANHMKNFTKGAEGWTKSRIELDLNRVYNTPEGEFRLMDIFETDQISLLRSQAGRASGDVALTKFGVQGKEGLRLLRKSMEYGEGGKQATNGERQVFDQIAAEFLNEPFGNQQGRWADRLLTANAVVRLGGVVFNQAAEAFNAVSALGVAAAFKHIPDFTRLRNEAITLAKGGQVNNSLLNSIETGGAEFGVDNYKIVMPFDNPNHVNPAFGQDTVTATDRLLRGAGHLQSKISGWRAVHAVQQRGMAEQIVLKMARYSRSGEADNALDDMGITPELRQAINASGAATYDARGNPSGFDLTRIPDANQREAIAQAVWRGTNQIIQGTFIGERGLWAHDNMLKLFTQFRTFSLTAMEKQTSRHLRVHGAYSLFGKIAASMAVAIPLYMARTYLASIGREDQDEYLEQRLSPLAMAQGLTNYIGVTGLAGDVMGLGLGVAGVSTSNRAGTETAFVGNYIAPALSLVDDTWKLAQGVFTDDNTLEQALRLVPGSRIPYVVPFFNLAKD